MGEIDCSPLFRKPRRRKRMWVARCICCRTSLPRETPRVDGFRYCEQHAVTRDKLAGYHAKRREQAGNGASNAFVTPAASDCQDTGNQDGSLTGG